MNRSQLSFLIALLLDIAVLLLVLSCVIGTLHGGGEGNMTKHSPFRYFTYDSNILAALTCLVSIPFCTAGMITPSYRLPNWLMLFRFTGTVSVSLTMMTVLLFLGPLFGYPAMFEGRNLLLHLICPLLAILSFVFFEKSAPLTGAHTLWALLPTVLYGTLYFLLVIIKKVWEDFYGFNRAGNWPLSIVLMLAGTWLISFLLKLLHNAG